jgi:hypothetical protein
MLNDIKKFITRACARTHSSANDPYALSIRREDEDCNVFEKSWPVRYLFLKDNIHFGGFPQYEKYPDEYVVCANHSIYAPNRICPEILYKDWYRFSPPMIHFSSLMVPSNYDNIEHLAMRMLEMAADIRDVDYRNLDEIKIYHKDIDVSLSTIITPTSGPLRVMAEKFALDNENIKVFHSKYLNEHNRIIAVPSPEYYSVMPSQYRRYGLSIYNTKAVCSIRG